MNDPGELRFALELDGYEVTYSRPVEVGRVCEEILADVSAFKAAGIKAKVYKGGRNGHSMSVTDWALATSVRPFAYEGKPVISFGLEPEEGKVESRDAAAFENVEKFVAALPAAHQAALAKAWETGEKVMGGYPIKAELGIEIGFAAGSNGKLRALDVRVKSAIGGGNGGGKDAASF